MIRLYAIAAIAALGLFSLVWLGQHERSIGFAAGEKAGAERAAVAQDKQRVAEVNQTACALSLRAVNADAALAQAAAAVAAEREVAAVKRAAAFQAQNAKDAAAFTAKLKAATARPECSGLKEQICAAVPFPY